LRRDGQLVFGEPDRELVAVFDLGGGPRSCSMRVSCSATSGTIRLAASAGVEGDAGHVIKRRAVLLVPDRADTCTDHEYREAGVITGRSTRRHLRC
jgi:hypothetical protein